MANAKISKAWFSKAGKDLRTAKVLLDFDDSFLDTIAFHCQQCVEKSLKGFLVFNNLRVPKTHVIDELTRLAVGIASDLKIILEPAGDFTDFAVAYRYPDAVQKDELTKMQMVAVVKTTEVIFQHLSHLVFVD